MAKNPPFPPHPLPKGAKATKELLKYVPQLSLNERGRRWDGIRKKMMLANIDVLLFMGTMLLGTWTWVWSTCAMKRR